MKNANNRNLLELLPQFYGFNYELFDFKFDSKIQNIKTSRVESHVKISWKLFMLSSSSSWLEACLPIASHRYRVPDNCSPSRPVRRNFTAGILPLPLPNIGSHPWGFQNGLQIFCHSSSPGLSHSPWWALPRCSLVEQQCLSGDSVLCHPEHMPAPFQAHLSEEWIQWATQVCHASDGRRSEFSLTSKEFSSTSVLECVQSGEISFP